MRHEKLAVACAVLFAALGASVLAQEPVPKEAFRSVHLVTLRSAADEAAVLAAFAEINAAVAEAGYPEIRYRLYKVTGEQSGNHNYLWESSWPGGAVYDKVHKHPKYEAAVKKHPAVDTLRKREIYNRYVEVAHPKP